MLMALSFFIEGASICCYIHILSKVSILIDLIDTIGIHAYGVSYNDFKVYIEEKMNREMNMLQVWSYIIRLIKPYPLSVCIMFWVAFVWAINVSVNPYLVKVILNRLSTSASVHVFHYLAVPIIIYLLMRLVIAVSFRFYGYFVEIRMIPYLRAAIADDALDKLIDKSHSYYQHNYSGSLTNKVKDLISSVPEIMQITIDRFISNSFALIVAIVTLWQVSKFFAFFMLFWSTSFIGGALIFSRRIVRFADKWSEFGSMITGKIADVLSNILSVRLFAGKAIEKRHLQESFKEGVAAEKRLQWAYFWMWMYYGFSYFALQVLNFYLLCKGRQDGWITVGDFALVLMINLSIFDFMWSVAKDFSQFSKLYGRITQALRSIVDESDCLEKTNAVPLVISEGTIVFEGVKFNYHGAESLFQNKSVTIRAGQKVGLVGYSGSGKSTFVNLILRLYDITDGRILIDGQDIREVRQDSLRRQIGMIPQDPSLFHRSVIENIRYGKALATDQEVVEAAKKAHAHEFIMALPEHYESLVGERGIKLSGGQRQRISIARAILKNAPILMLDEATSQLDSITEEHIQESLWHLMQGKTTLVIAHRLSTLLHMDRILVFDLGKIVGDGSHDQLLKNCPMYQALWNAQIGGFLPDRKEEGSS
jgi:ATP-binding cassette subfamily B protein